jgi:hypothetical protein
MMKATYTPDTGFSDIKAEPLEVTILGFVHGSYAPGYKSSGTHTGVLAVVALPDQSITPTELRFLRYAPPHSPADSSSPSIGSSDRPN